MKPALFIKLIVLSLSLLASHVYANEAVRSSTSSSNSAASKNTTAADSVSQINKVGTCPKTLVDSINDDRGTKMLGVFSKVEKSCGNYTLDAPGQIAMNMRYSKTPELYKSNLETMLSKKVSSQLKFQLEGCRQLPPEMQAAIATRLYSASLRFDDFNTRIAEQIAYIDNLVPENDTNDFECSELFPNTKNKCPKSFRNVCKAKSEDRLNDMAKETANTLAKINTAKNLLDACKSKNFAGVMRLGENEKQKYFGKKCGAELKLIQFLESKNTWLTSPKFLKSVTLKPIVCTGGNQARGTSGPKTCTDPVLKDEKEIMKAIQKELTEDRKVLISAHKKSIKDFKCMYSNKVDNTNCNFQDIRKTLVEIGDSGHVKLPAGANYEENVKKIELEQYLGIEKCTLELGQDRQIATDEIKDAVGHAAVDVALTLGTAGLGSVAAASRLIAKAGRAAKIAQKAAAVGAAVGTDVYYGAQSVRNVIKECKNKKLSESKISVNYDQDKSNSDYRLKVCSDPKSVAIQIKEIEDGCLESALWAAVDTLSIGVGAKGFIDRAKNLPAVKTGIIEKLADKKVSAAVQSEVDKAVKDKQALLELYKDPKQREAVEAILKKNGQLTDVERGNAAEALLGKKLSPSEKKCIVNAHNIGAGKYMKTAETEAIGAPLLTSSDLLEKKSALTGCGFQVTDVALLMRAGITGSTPDSAKEFIRKASVKLFGKDLDSAKVDAVWDAAGKKSEDQIKKLTAAGFTESEATRIANREFDKLNPNDVRSVVLKDSLAIQSAAPQVAQVAKPTATASLADAKEYIRKASVKLFGKDLDSAKVDAVWDAAGKKSEDQIKKLTAAGFTESEATRIANREFDKLNPNDVRAVVLKDAPAVQSAVPQVAQVAKPTATASLADAFERQDSDKIKAAYKASRDEAVQTATQNRTNVVASPNKILDLSTRGLKVDESADLMKAAFTGDDGFKKAMGLIDERVTTASKNNSFQNEYNQFKLQELKVKLMDDFYGAKYKDKWQNLDLDHFYDTDEAGFEAFKKAQEKLEQMKKKANSRWPG